MRFMRQAREGFLMFRVHGTSRIGTNYRLIVLLINVTFGILAGMQPLLAEGSAEALVQGTLVLVLQACSGGSKRT